MLVVAVICLTGVLGCVREIAGNIPLTEREISPSELGPENVDLSSFDGSYRMWRRLVCFHCMLNTNDTSIGVLGTGQYWSVLGWIGYWAILFLNVKSNTDICSLRINGCHPPPTVV